MLFPTLSFAAFFAVVLPVSWLLMPHRVRWRLFLVAVSWMFYGAADWRFVPLLAGSTVVNHYFARRIHRASGVARRNWTIAAVATNLSVLAWFKYIGFLSLSFQSGLHFFGIHAHVPLPEVLLPIGISFFTFQALSYVIDVSRGKIQPVSLLEFAVYLSFFPHLVAGPIVRASEFLPQIKERISPRHIDVGKAFWLISLGLFKKVVIASYLATYAADPLFGFPRQHAGAEALVGVYAYAIQIYADFSGYTDIAIGLALLFGIRFPQNFNAPYAAASLQDFWRRWHMTLSRWLRDYLYIPLGGSRRGRARTYVNLMITMLLGGLWHGAAWTFVAWGALHGGGLAVERWRSERRGEPARATPADDRPDSGKEAPVPLTPPPPEPAPLADAPTGRRPKLVTFAQEMVGSGTVATATAAPTNGAFHVAPRPDAEAPGGAPAGDEGAVAVSDPLSPAPAPAAPAPAAAAPAPGPGPGPDSGRGTPALAPAVVTEEASGRPAPGAGFRLPYGELPAGPDDPPRRGFRLPFGHLAPASPPGADGPPRRLLGEGMSRPALSPAARLWVGRLITFHVVCLAWIFFRATSFHNALEVLQSIVTLGRRHHALNWKVVAVIVVALAIQVGPHRFGSRLQVWFSRTSFWYQALILAAVLTVIDLLGPAGVAPFIYFRF